MDWWGIVIGLAIVVGLALYWAAYTRPENVLARFEKDLGIRQEFRLSDRLSAAHRTLGERHARIVWRLRGTVLRSMPAGKEQDELVDCLTAYATHPANPDGLDDLWQDVGWDLMNSPANTGDLCDLEDDVQDLIADLRTLQRLERAFHKDADTVAAA